MNDTITTVLRGRGRPVGSKNTVPMVKQNSEYYVLRRIAFRGLADESLDLNKGYEDNGTWIFPKKNKVGRPKGEQKDLPLGPPRPRGRPKKVESVLPTPEVNEFDESDETQVL